MRIQTSLLLLTLLLPLSAFAQVDYARHVAFDNSLASDSFYYSHGLFVAPSELELVHDKLPVEENHSVSPPNSLRLKWRSRTGGDWRVTLYLRDRYGSPEFRGSNLFVWCYAEEDLPAQASPRIYLRDSNGEGTPSIELTGSLPKISARKWTRVRLPLDSFAGPINSAQGKQFDPQKLYSLTLVQGLDDGQPHTLYLDDIEIADDPPASSQPSVAPTGLTAKGYDRHIDLSWTPVTNPAVQYYKIYRSYDGKPYAPIGIQEGDRGARYEDFLGVSGKSASYKITTVDVTGKESPRSSGVQAATRSLTDDELLTMVQEACFRYYWEGGHPNAGMAIEILPGDKNLVAVGASGFGIMALVVGVDRGFITREQGTERLLKIVRFLAKADRFHGVWPHFLDGRTGKVIHYFGSYDDGGDLVETAFLMQGLLVARQYFNRDTAGEREIRDTVTSFWKTVEWDWYRQGPDPNFLYWHWSPDHGFYIHHPLIGWNETMIIYLLAMPRPRTRSPRACSTLDSPASPTWPCATGRAGDVPHKAITTPTAIPTTDRNSTSASAAVVNSSSPTSLSSPSTRVASATATPTISRTIAASPSLPTPTRWTIRANSSATATTPGPLGRHQRRRRPLAARRRQRHHYLHRCLSLVPLHSGRINESAKTFLPRSG